MNLAHDPRVTPEHLSRTAVVYVRQSSARQVEQHVESTRVQLGLREKAISLGWRSPSVIDADLGTSAAELSDRPGFQSLLARIAMKEVGIILCVDASRLSRNSKDWAHLFELCSYFNTLISDLDQIYDLSLPNDRLVIGIKGTVSEMELTVLRTRMHTALVAKAARGELRIPLPTGYVYDPSGKIVFDPDKRVQSAIGLLFDQFDRSTSLRQLAMWYRDNKTLLPVSKGRWGKTTRWVVPTGNTLRVLVDNPIYAGAYVWGRRNERVEYVEGRLVKRLGSKKSVDEARVCIRDHHPAYITWERFLENRSKIAENRPRWNMQQNRGAIREGRALLAGILRCGHCGNKIYVSHNPNGALYYCDGGQGKGTKRCFSFGAKGIDERVSEELLRAVSPLGIQAAVAAAELSSNQRSQEIENARLQVQAAQYEADRAFEQFDLCDPKNRLVADSLEERLNDKLVDLQAAKERLQALSEKSPELTDRQLERLRGLGRDFPAAWSHASADPKLKKQLMRSVIEEVVVRHESQQQRLEVTIHWKGGVHTRIHVKKRAPNRSRKTDASLTNLIAELASELSDADIARILSMQKRTSPGGLAWTQDRITAFRHRHKIRSGKRRREPDLLTMNQARNYLGVSQNALMGLVRRGAVTPNQITEYAPWRVSRAELDSDRVWSLVRALKDTGRLPKGGCPENQLSFFDDQH